MSRESKIDDGPHLRRIRRYADYDPKLVTDYLVVAAANIEDALIKIGATPNNYTLLDVMRLAVTLVAPALAQPGCRVRFDVPTMDNCDSGDQTADSTDPGA